MELREFVTIEEVKKACKELNIRDWSELTEEKVTADEAGIILTNVNSAGMNIDVEEFRRGLEVELEHGVKFKDANITNNHPLITGKIVLAHLKESLDYYKYLEVAELEFDLLKAVKAKNLTKIEDLYKRLAKAKHIVTHVELNAFK